MAEYLDRVENSILKQVAYRSKQFFQVCASQKAFSEEIELAKVQVDELREHLQHIQQRSVVDKLKLMGLFKKEQRVKAVQKMVYAIVQVRQHKESIEALVHTQEYLQALHLATSTMKMAAMELKHVACIEDTLNNIKRIQRDMQHKIIQQFIHVVMDMETEDKNKLHMDMTPYVNVLLEMNILSDAIATYQEQAIAQLKATIKVIANDVIETSQASTNSDSTVEDSFARKLTALTSEDFLKFIRLAFEQLLVALHRIADVDQLLKKHDLAQEQCTESWNVVRETCSLAERSIGNIIRVRLDVQVSFA